jgi:hypothetical protein
MVDTPAAPPTAGETLYEPLPPRVDPPATPDAPTAAAPDAPAPEPAAPEPKPDAPATPEALADFTLPDGFTADPALMTQLKEALSTDGLSMQERGQKLVDMYAKMQTESAAEQAEAWETVQTEWRSTIEKDPVLGGSNTARTQEVLGKALDVYGNDAVREAFALTGAGNNPDVVRFIHKMAVALNEGTHVAPTGPTNGTGRTRGQILYGDNPTQ